MARRGPRRPALQQEPDAQAGREGRHQGRAVEGREAQIQGPVPPRRAPQPGGRRHEVLLPQARGGKGPPRPGRSQPARTEKQAGQQLSVVQNGFDPGQACGESRGRAELQQDAENPRDQALLAQSEPDHARPLQGPGRGGPGGVQGHGHGQGHEDDAQGQMGLAQQAQPRPRRAGPRCVAPGAKAADADQGQQVPKGQAQAAEGPAHVRVAHQPHLQGEGGQGQAEDQCAVQTRVLARGPGEEDGDDSVHDEEEDEERLGGGEVLRRVVACAPGRADAEGAGEAQEIQGAPGSAPGDAEHPRVQQGVVGEEVHVAALPGGQQDRSQETAGRAEKCQGHGVLGHGQDAGEDHDAGHERQRPHRRQHPDVARRGEDGQVQDAHAAALDQQGVDRLAPPQPPAQGQQRDAQQPGPGHAQLHGHQAVVRGVLEQKGHAEEEHDDADLDHGVPAREPVPHRPDPFPDPGLEARQRRLRRRPCSGGRTGRCRPGRSFLGKDEVPCAVIRSRGSAGLDIRSRRARPFGCGPAFKLAEPAFQRVDARHQGETDCAEHRQDQDDGAAPEGVHGSGQGNEGQNDEEDAHGASGADGSAAGCAPGPHFKPLPRSGGKGKGRNEKGPASALTETGPHIARGTVTC
ncbi:hypothetical protein DSECCO2_461880 [anaerobic digester metagenome]